MPEKKHTDLPDFKGTCSIRFPDEEPTRQELVRYVEEMSEHLPAFFRFNLSEVIRPLIRAGLKLHGQGLLDDAIAGAKFEATSEPDTTPKATE